MSPATGLGSGESPGLNIAFPVKGGTGRNRIRLVAHRAESSMDKAILPKSYLPGGSSRGRHLVRERMRKGNWVMK